MLKKSATRLFGSTPKVRSEKVSRITALGGVQQIGGEDDLGELGIQLSADVDAVLCGEDEVGSDERPTAGGGDVLPARLVEDPGQGIS